MHLFNRRPHEGSSSVIQIGEGMNVIEVEILEVVGEQVSSASLRRGRRRSSAKRSSWSACRSSSQTVQ